MQCYKSAVFSDVALHSSNVWIPYSLLQPTVQSRVESTEQLEKLVLQTIRIEKLNGVNIKKKKNSINKF